MNLEFYGYKKFDIQADDFGTTEKYQRRVDTDANFTSPLCQCNDKVFINIERFTSRHFNNPSSKVNLVHENGQKEWCDIGVYGLSDDQLMTYIEKYEAKLLQMWEVFNQ